MAKRQKKIVNEPMEVKQNGPSNATKNKPITKESFTNFANAFKSGFQDVSDAFSFSGGSKQKKSKSPTSKSDVVDRPTRGKPKASTPTKSVKTDSSDGKKTPNTLPVNLRPRGAGRMNTNIAQEQRVISKNKVAQKNNIAVAQKNKPKVSNESVSPDVMRKEQLAQRRQQAAKAPAKNAVASSVSNGGSVKSSAKDTAYRNMANRKAQATKQNTTQTQPKKTFNANEAMAQRRAAAQAQGKGNWNANEEMKRRREQAAYNKAFGKGK